MPSSSSALASAGPAHGIAFIPFLNLPSKNLQRFGGERRGETEVLRSLFESGQGGGGATVTLTWAEI